jgi:predicted NodU family carbamoyl transferase
MQQNKRDVYVLGTGLSHDGSACLLKNGKIRVAIEKERITRIKHDGGSDYEAILYCLDQEGITIYDLDLIVQNANFGNFKNGNYYYKGPRIFDPSFDVPIVTISHHMAHAYYALGTCPYEETAILVIDGAGTSYDDCMDIGEATIIPEMVPPDLTHLFFEKDSLYVYKDQRLECIYKDVSPWGYSLKMYSMHTNTTQHSIGGFYHGAADYCFGDQMDVGKLMGLAPYGRPGIYRHRIFELRDGRVFVNYGDWLYDFRDAARQKSGFWKNFQYYADIAYWVQQETERAIEYVIRERRKLVDTDNLSFTGGVALNAVANGKILKKSIFENIYFTPAAGDNGLSIGCAYYGWLEVLKRERVCHDGKSTFGKVYSTENINSDLSRFFIPTEGNNEIFIILFFEKLPLFLNKKGVTKERYQIEITFSGWGTYFVTIFNDKIEVSRRSAFKSDCLLYTDVSNFIGMLEQNHFFSASTFNDKTVLEGDFIYFRRAVNLGALSQAVIDAIKENPAARLVKFKRAKDFISQTAQILADGKVIGWFQNESEFGPRALGNRSILADPRKKGVQKFINNEVKFREDFRPFAPVIMREYVSEYFQFCGDSPYMIIVAPIAEKWKDEVAGVVHVDGSCRIQTVTEASNERLYELLREFKAITGLPMLLNTSFNKKGMPIVETPMQALSYFFECALDYLVMDDYIISK